MCIDYHIFQLMKMTSINSTIVCSYEPLFPGPSLHFASMVSLLSRCLCLKGDNLSSFHRPFSLRLLWTLSVKKKKSNVLWKYSIMYTQYVSRKIVNIMNCVVEHLLHTYLSIFDIQHRRPKSWFAKYVRQSGVALEHWI